MPAVLIGATELLDAERLATLSQARSAIADVGDSLSRVSSGLGIARHRIAPAVLLRGTISATPLARSARSGARAATHGLRMGSRTAPVAPGDAWSDVSMHAGRAADLLQQSIGQPVQGAASARRFGGLDEAQAAVTQLRNLAREAADPATRDIEFGADRFSLAAGHVDRAMTTTTWNHVAPNAGEVRVHFRDGDLQRIVGDGRVTGSAAEQVARRADATMADVQQWFRTRFGHDGFDGAGHDVDVQLNVEPNGMFASAQRTADGSGIVEARAFDGDGGGSLAGVQLAAPATDTGSMTHEYAHLVQAASYDRDLSPSERDLPRNLLEKSVHEGVSDIFEALCTRRWTIGSQLLLGAGTAGAADGKVALRHIGGDPATSLRPLATTLPEMKRMLRSGEGDAHVLGGVVSQAGRNLQDRIGGQALGDLTYATVQDGGLRRGSINPRSWADRTLATAQRLWSGTPAGDIRVDHVRQALVDSGFAPG